MDKISVILPTRDNSRSATESIDSLYRRANSPEDIEMLIALDNDDTYSYAVLSNQYPNAIIHAGERYGYEELHRYVNGLCELSTGKWLFLWNDDAFMETENWDEIIRESGSPNELIVLNPRTSHNNYVETDDNLFPIISRELYELLGHFSLNRHNDSWIQHLATTTGIQKNIDVRIRHEWDNSKTELYDKEWPKTYTEQLSDDINKVNEYNKKR